MTGDEARYRVGGGRLVEPHAGLAPAEVRERGRKIGGLAQIGEALEVVA